MKLARVFPFLAVLFALCNPVRLAAQSGSAATFLRSDTATQGNWHGAYGSDGYSVAEDSQNLPGYAVFSLQNQQDYTWQGTTADSRALQTGSGLGRIAAGWYNASSFSLDVNLADGNTHQIALYAVDWDNQQRSETVQVLDAATATVLDTRTLSNFANGIYLVWTVNGHVTITITQNSGVNAVLSGIFFGGSSAITSAAHFVSSDATTQGNWHGAYGADGYSLANNAQSVPAYASFAPQNQSNYMWASSSTDPRALQTGNGLGRIAATWYSSSEFDLDVNVTDGNTHQVSLYAVDWDLSGRSEAVQVLDAATEAVLDTETLSAFTNGEYLVWNISGHVKINVIQTAGVNAVVSGIFFGGGSSVSSSASFVRSDTTTQGNWHGAYGADGYSIAGDSQSLPAYAAFAPVNASTFVWNSDPAQTSAPQTGSGSGRIAAAWYNNPAFNFDVNITDGNSHQVALYALDFDTSGRSEVIQVLDAATDALLDTRTVSAFSTGTYLVWNLSGHVTINVLSAAGPNAVMSGVFFGGSSTITSTATFVHSDATTQGAWQGAYGADGYSVASAAQSLPSYVTFALQNQSNWVWDPNPSDPRALETGTGSGLIAATWYNNPSFSLDVNITDGHAHQFSLYAVDWDSQGRSQVVQVLDAATEAVLDTETLSTFTSGVYLVWTISGHVRINLIDMTGPNAVVSGVFFDPPPSSGSGSGGSPTIASLSAYSGGIGAPITISGSNFGAAQGSSTVTFNGVAATPTSWSATQIVAPVPSGATTGPVVVTVGVASNGVSFTVEGGSTSPTITGLSPFLEQVGVSVTIAGTGFGTRQGSSSITFNGIPATATAWSDTNIVATVPPGATTGYVVVMVGGVASNQELFAIVPPLPTITSLSPPAGIGGTAVTINGTAFGTTSGAVTFNGLPATPTGWSNTAISVAVPAGATTGPVVVTGNGEPSNGVAFTVTGPVLTGLSSHVGAVGDPVTLYGANFGAAPAGSSVTFNGVSAAPSGWNNTTILVPVPAGATPGPVAVTVSGATSNSTNFTPGPPDTITGIGVSSPSNGATVSTPYVAVTGTVAGSISGIDPIVVTCNESAAKLTGTNFSCNPPLVAGVNSITVTGADSAGDTQTATFSVTLGMAAPVSITVTPGPVIMVVGQTQTFTAVDDQGMRRPDVTWTVSDSTIATFVDSSPNTVVATAVGQVTLTATVGAVTGQTTITVLPSGTALPIGTVLWSATPVSGCAAQQIVQAVATADGPDLYSLEQCPDGSTLVRAFKSTGEQLWQSQLNPSQYGYSPQGVGDNFGGLLLIGSPNQSDGSPYGIIADLDGQSGAQAWQYTTSGYSFISFGAVGLDGSVHAVESVLPSGGGELSYLDSIDGASGGLQSKIQLPLSSTYFNCPDLSRPEMSSFSTGTAPAAVGPDGALYAEVGTSRSVTESNCEFGPQPFEVGNFSGNLSLMRVSPDGGVGFSSLDSSSSRGITAGEVIPDGNGGVLASWINAQNATMMANVGTSGAQATFSTLGGLGGLVLGDNNTAFTTDGSTVLSFDASSLAPHWTYSSSGGSLTLVAATSGGGVTINDSQLGIIQLDSSGNAGAPAPNLQGAQYYGNGLWLGISGDPELAEMQGGFMDWVSTAWAWLTGSKSGGRTQPRYDLELVWCTNGLCATLNDPDLTTGQKDQDVAFSIRADDPPHNTTALTASQTNVIQQNAVNAFKLAFTAYNVNTGAGRQGTNTVYVVGQNSSKGCGGTAPLVYSSSAVYYPVNSTEAQFAVSDTAGSPTPGLLAALGEGIGNNAAHEIAHELVNAGSISGKIVKLMDLDDSSLDTYNGADCSGSNAPWVYTGKDANGVPIHWETDAVTSFKNVFGTSN
jgi:IPT/TIG domain/Glucodextranase, domain B/Bacterial Ig-like domain (group 2)